MSYSDFRSRLIVLCLTICASVQVTAKELTVLYTNNPPLICAKNGELDCLAGTLMKNAAKAGGFTLKASEVPWARAQETLDSNPNTVFAATGRNEFSEAQFGWFFRVYTDDVFVWTLRDKKVANDGDLAKLGKINVRRGSPFGAYLDKRGFGSKIYETADWVQGAQMLNEGRVDGMCLTGLIGRTNIIDIQKIPEAQVNKYKVGEMAWYINSKHGAAPSAELMEFKKLMEAEKAKPYFVDMLNKFGVRD